MPIPKWAAEAVVYHIYPLGFLGAPSGNPRHGEPTLRLAHLIDWIPHLQAMGVTCVQLGPIFESAAHGYDTIDYYQIDRRLGDMHTFRRVLSAFHAAGIRVILDGVFNHSGRDFFAFRSILAEGVESPYATWYFIDPDGTSARGDAFDYRSWEGHTRLPLFNHADPAFREYIFGVMRFWLGGVGVDGWRLDVGHELPLDFLQDLARVCREANPDCFLVTEAVEGNYATWVAAHLTDSATNYQTYSHLRTAFNARDLRPLRTNLTNTFGARRGIYRTMQLMNFIGNHDVSRVMSDLVDEAYVYPAHILLATLPGIPTHYYGDEIGLRGHKSEGDPALRRPMPPANAWPNPALYDAVCRIAAVRQRAADVFVYGAFRVLVANTHTFAFVRWVEGQAAIVAINISEEPQPLHLDLSRTIIHDGTHFVPTLNPDQPVQVVKGRALTLPTVWPNWGCILLSKDPHA